MNSRSRRHVCFALVLLVNFFTMSISMALEPLIPPLAKEKGMSSSLTGLFIGVVILTIGLSSTLTRPLLSFVSIRFSIVSGAFCAGVCSILTGILQFSPPGTTFIVLCFVVNIMASIGSGVLVMGAFSTLPVLYPQRMGFAGGCMLFSNTASFAMTPPIAGVLSDIGGFMLPMAFFGSAVIITGVFCAIFIDIEAQEDESFTETVRVGAQVSFNPSIIITILTIFFSTLAFGFTSPTLEPFLETVYDLSPTDIGLLFLVSAAGGFISPLIGMICDRSMIWTKLLQAPGLIFCGLSILLWSPSPILNLDGERLWLTGISLGTFGLAMSQLLGSAIADLFQESERKFGPSELYASVTAILFNLIYNVGLFFGSVFGGLALDTIGFDDATTLLGCTMGGLSVLNVTYQLLRIRWIKRLGSDDMRRILPIDSNSKHFRASSRIGRSNGFL